MGKSLEFIEFRHVSCNEVIWSFQAATSRPAALPAADLVSGVCSVMKNNTFAM